MTDQYVDLLNLDEPALERLYAERIEPILRQGEADRRTAMNTYTFRRNLGVAGAIAAAVAVYMLMESGEINALIAGGVVFGIAHWYAYNPLAAVGSATKTRSLTAIANAIGCTYGAGKADGLALFKEMSLLPSYDRANFEDRFGGAHQGCGYAFYDAHLEDRVQTKNGTRWQTVFRGQLISIDFPKRFQGKTVVRRDAGMFNFMQRWTTSLDRVGLGDSRLEKAFEVYSNDQVEARYLIHPVFMERLLELETQFKGKRLRCAFVQGDLIIAVEGGDKFEIGSMFARLDDIARVRAIAADIAGILRVIDAVLTAEQGALPTT